MRKIMIFWFVFLVVLSYSITLACIGEYNTFYVVRFNKETQVDIQKLRGFSSNYSNENEILYKSHYNDLFVVQIEKTAKVYILELGYSPSKSPDLKYSKEALKMELELLIKNGLISNFTFADVKEMEKLLYPAMNESIFYDEHAQRWWTMEHTDVSSRSGNLSLASCGGSVPIITVNFPVK